MEKRNSRKKPRKLGLFISPAESPQEKDGASSLTHTDQLPGNSVRRKTQALMLQQPEKEQQNEAFESDFISPVKQRRKVSSGDKVSDIEIDCDSDADINPYEVKLDSFPTSGKAMLDTDMKEMLKSLHGAIQHDMRAFMQKSKAEIGDLGERVDYIENKMTDFTDAHNELVDDHFALEEEVRQLKLKVSDLEDRSRRNNIKFRGIPENVKNNDLRIFLQKMFVDLIPSLQKQDLVIDRAHRLPKPSHITAKLPRDVIAKIHFFQTKDMLMHFARHHAPLPDPYAGIILYSDLSQATILARKNLNPITKILRNHKLIYRWGFPTKLSVEKDNMSHTIHTLEDGLKILKKWNLLPNDESTPIDGTTKEKLTAPWNVSHG